MGPEGFVTEEEGPAGGLVTEAEEGPAGGRCLGAVVCGLCTAWVCCGGRGNGAACGLITDMNLTAL